MADLALLDIRTEPAATGAIDPACLDLRRANAGEHLTFGYGIHFCTGAPLARLEGQVAFPRVLRRFPKLALADPDPPWSDSILTRGMLEMRVRV